MVDCGVQVAVSYDIEPEIQVRQCPCIPNSLHMVRSSVWQAAALQALRLASTSPLCTIATQLELQRYLSLLSHQDHSVVAAAAELLSGTDSALDATLQLAVLVRVAQDVEYRDRVTAAFSERITISNQLAIN